MTSAVQFPLMFLSGTFFPIATMADALQTVARLLPLTYLGDALRQVMVDGTPFAPLWVCVAVLLSGSSSASDRGPLLQVAVAPAVRPGVQCAAQHERALAVRSEERRRPTSARRGRMSARAACGHRPCSAALRAAGVGRVAEREQVLAVVVSG